MKVVVIGGTGLIGSKVVTKLNEHRHEAIAASPASGVNTLTGEGLDEVLTGAQVVVDVSNSPCGSRPPYANPWRPMTLQRLSPAPRSASPSAASSSLPAPTGTRSTTSSAHGSARRATPAASSRIRKRATSAWCSTTRPWFPATTATVFPTRFADWLIDNAPAPVR